MINTADVQIPTLPHQVRGLRTLGQDPTSLIAEASYLPPILGPHIVCASACEVLLKHKQDDATALLRSLSCFSLTQSKHESPRKGPRGPLCPDTSLSCRLCPAPCSLSSVLCLRGFARTIFCLACSFSGCWHDLLPRAFQLFTQKLFSRGFFPHILPMGSTIFSYPTCLALFFFSL